MKYPNFCNRNKFFSIAARKASIRGRLRQLGSVSPRGLLAVGVLSLSALVGASATLAPENSANSSAINNISLKNYAAGSTDVSPAPISTSRIALSRPWHESYINGANSYFGELLEDEIGLAAFDDYLKEQARDALIDRANGNSTGGLGLDSWLAAREQTLRDLSQSLPVQIIDHWTNYLITEGETAAQGLGFVRNIDADYRSEVGGRKWSGGISALGSLHEKQDRALAWQLRGYGADDSALGINAGLIYRIIPEGAGWNYLLGVNTFWDYEDGDYGDFARMSFGAEVRTAWVDLFGNFYNPISDSVVLADGSTAYTQGGHDIAMRVHSPSVRWLTGGLTYYNFDGEAGDEDASGIRYHLSANVEELAVQIPGLQLYVEYDSGNSTDNNSFGAGFTYRHFVNAADKGISTTRNGGFQPRDYLFAPVVREHTQRIVVRERQVSPDVEVNLPAGSGWWNPAGAGEVALTVATTATLVADATVGLRTAADSEISFTRGGAFEFDLNPNLDIVTRATYRGADSELELLEGEVYYRSAANPTVEEMRAGTHTFRLLGTEVSLSYDPNAANDNNDDVIVIQVNDGRVAIDRPHDDVATLSVIPPVASSESGDGESRAGDRVVVEIHRVSMSAGVVVTTSTEVEQTLTVVAPPQNPEEEMQLFNRLNLAGATSYYVDYEHTGAFATLSVVGEAGANIALVGSPANIGLASNVLSGTGGGIAAATDVVITMNSVATPGWFGIATLRVIPILAVVDSSANLNRTAVINETGVFGNVSAEGGNGSPLEWRKVSGASQINIQANGDLVFTNPNGVPAPTNFSMVVEVTDGDRTAQATINVNVIEGLDLLVKNFEVLEGNGLQVQIEGIGITGNDSYSFQLVSPPANVGLGTQSGTAGKDQIITLGDRSGASEIVVMIEIDDGNPGNALDARTVTITITVLASVAATPDVTEANVYDNLNEDRNIATVELTGGRASYSANIVSGNPSNQFSIRADNNSADTFIVVANIADHTSGDLVIEFTSADGLSTATVTITITAIPVVSIDSGQDSFTALVETQVLAHLSASDGYGNYSWSGSGGDGAIEVVTESAASDQRGIIRTTNSDGFPESADGNTYQVTVFVSDDGGNSATLTVDIMVIAGLGLEQTEFYILAGPPAGFVDLQGRGAADASTYQFSIAGSPPPPPSFSLGSQSNTGQIQLQVLGAVTAGQRLVVTINVDDGAGNLDAMDIEVALTGVDSVAVANPTDIPDPINVYMNVRDQVLFSITLTGGDGDFTLVPNTDNVNLSNFSIVPTGTRGEYIVSALRAAHTSGQVTIAISAADGASSVNAVLNINAVPAVSVDDGNGDDNIALVAFVRSVLDTDEIGSVEALNGLPPFAWSVSGADAGLVNIAVDGTNPRQANLTWSSGTPPTSTGTHNIVVQVRDDDNFGATDTANVQINVREGLGLDQTEFEILSGAAREIVLMANGSSDGDFVFDLADGTQAGISKGAQSGTANKDIIINFTQALVDSGSFNFMITVSNPTSTSGLPSSVVQINVAVVEPVAVDTSSIPNPLAVYNLAEDRRPVLTVQATGGVGAFEPASLSGVGAGNFTIGETNGTRGEFVLRANRTTHSDGVLNIGIRSSGHSSNVSVPVTIAPIPVVSIGGSGMFDVLDGETIIGNMVAENGLAGYTWEVLEADPQHPAVFTGSQLSFGSAPPAGTQVVMTIRVTDALGNTADREITVNITEGLAGGILYGTGEYDHFPSYILLPSEATSNSVLTLTVRGASSYDIDDALTGTDGDSIVDCDATSTSEEIVCRGSSGIVAGNSQTVHIGITKTGDTATPGLTVTAHIFVVDAHLGFANDIRGTLVGINATTSSAGDEVANVAASGGTPPNFSGDSYTYELAPRGAQPLPSWLGISSSGQVTLLSAPGASEAGETYAVVVRVSDTSGAQAEYDLNINVTGGEQFHGDRLPRLSRVSGNLLKYNNGVPVLYLFRDDIVLDPAANNSFHFMTVWSPRDTNQGDNIGHDSDVSDFRNTNSFPESGTIGPGSSNDLAVQVYRLLQTWENSQHFRPNAGSHAWFQRVVAQRNTTARDAFYFYFLLIHPDDALTFPANQTIKARVNTRGATDEALSISGGTPAILNDDDVAARIVRREKLQWERPLGWNRDHQEYTDPFPNAPGRGDPVGIPETYREHYNFRITDCGNVPEYLGCSTDPSESHLGITPNGNFYFNIEPTAAGTFTLEVQASDPSIDLITNDTNEPTTREVTLEIQDAASYNAERIRLESQYEGQDLVFNGVTLFIDSGASGAVLNISPQRTGYSGDLLANLNNCVDSGCTIPDSDGDYDTGRQPRPSPVPHNWGYSLSGVHATDGSAVLVLDEALSEARQAWVYIRRDIGGGNYVSHGFPIQIIPTDVDIVATPPSGATVAAYNDDAAKLVQGRVVGGTGTPPFNWTVNPPYTIVTATLFNGDPDLYSFVVSNPTPRTYNAGDPIDVGISDGNGGANAALQYVIDPIPELNATGVKTNFRAVATTPANSIFAQLTVNGGKPPLRFALTDDAVNTNSPILVDQDGNLSFATQQTNGTNLQAQIRVSDSVASSIGGAPSGNEVVVNINVAVTSTPDDIILVGGTDDLSYSINEEAFLGDPITVSIGNIRQVFVCTQVSGGNCTNVDERIVTTTATVTVLRQSFFGFPLEGGNGAYNVEIINDNTDLDGVQIGDYYRPVATDDGFYIAPRLPILVDGVPSTGPRADIAHDGQKAVSFINIREYNSGFGIITIRVTDNPTNGFDPAPALEFTVTFQLQTTPETQPTPQVQNDADILMVQQNYTDPRGRGFADIQVLPPNFQVIDGYPFAFKVGAKRGNSIYDEGNPDRANMDNDITFPTDRIIIDTPGQGWAFPPRRFVKTLIVAHADDNIISHGSIVEVTINHIQSPLTFVDSPAFAIPADSAADVDIANLNASSLLSGGFGAYPNFESAEHGGFPDTTFQIVGSPQGAVSNLTLSTDGVFGFQGNAGPNSGGPFNITIRVTEGSESVQSEVVVGIFSGPNITADEIINLDNDKDGNLDGEGVILPSFRGVVATLDIGIPSAAGYTFRTQNDNPRFIGGGSGNNQASRNVNAFRLIGPTAGKLMVNMLQMHPLGGDTEFKVTIEAVEDSTGDVVNSYILDLKTPARAFGSDHLLTEGAELLLIGAGSDYEDEGSGTVDAEREIWHLDDDDASVSNWHWQRWGDLYDDRAPSASTGCNNNTGNPPESNCAQPSNNANRGSNNNGSNLISPPDASDRFFVYSRPIVHGGTLYLFGGATDDSKNGAGSSYDRDSGLVGRAVFNPHWGDNNNLALLSAKSEWEVLHSVNPESVDGHPIDRVGGSIVPCDTNDDGTDDKWLTIGGGHNDYGGGGLNSDNNRHGDIWDSTDLSNWDSWNDGNSIKSYTAAPTLQDTIGTTYNPADRFSASVGEMMDTAVINGTIFVKFIEGGNDNRMRIFFSANCGDSWDSISLDHGAAVIRNHLGTRTRMVAYQGFLVLIGGANVDGNGRNSAADKADTLWYAVPFVEPEGGNNNAWSWYRATLPANRAVGSPAVGVYNGWLYVVGNKEGSGDARAYRTQDLNTFESLSTDGVARTLRGNLLVVPNIP